MQRSVGFMLSAAIALAATSAVADGPPTHWWLRTDLGPPAAGSRYAAMFTPSIDDETGASGLSLSSIGEGQGPARGLDSHGVRTVGASADLAALDAFDHASSALMERHTPRVARPAGHTPPDVIRRIIHENQGQFQLCYDIGLGLNPALQGRVVVKIVIDRNGSVAMAADARSDLPVDDVVRCVVRAFDTLSFPPSSDSAVTVVYPFAFTPTAAEATE